MSSAPCERGRDLRSNAAGFARAGRVACVRLNAGGWGGLLEGATAAAAAAAAAAVTPRAAGSYAPGWPRHDERPAARALAHVVGRRSAQAAHVEALKEDVVVDGGPRAKPPEHHRSSAVRAGACSWVERRVLPPSATRAISSLLMRAGGGGGGLRTFERCEELAPLASEAVPLALHDTRARAPSAAPRMDGFERDGEGDSLTGGAGARCARPPAVTRTLERWNESHVVATRRACSAAASQAGGGAPAEAARVRRLACSAGPQPGVAAALIPYQRDDNDEARPRRHTDARVPPGAHLPRAQVLQGGAMRRRGAAVAARRSPRGKGRRSTARVSSGDAAALGRAYGAVATARRAAPDPHFHGRRVPGPVPPARPPAAACRRDVRP